ncbi:hypothetical protein D3C85_852290 [compost metagenome]
MDDAEGQQDGPGVAAQRQAGEVGQRGQQQHAGADLDQRDQVRRHPTQPFDDERRYGIEQRRAQGQGDARQVVAAALTLPAMGADDGQHAGEGNRQPEQFLRGDLLAKEERRQAHQHEGLDVVHRRADGDRRPRIGGEQQHPVADYGDPAQHRQEEGSAGQDTGPQEAHQRADHQQRRRAEQAAPEHHIQHRLAGEHDQPADGPGDEHGGDHFHRTALYRFVHDGAPLYGAQYDEPDQGNSIIKQR